MRVYWTISLLPELGRTVTTVLVAAAGSRPRSRFRRGRGSSAICRDRRAVETSETAPLIRCSCHRPSRLGTVSTSGRDRASHLFPQVPVQLCLGDDRAAQVGNDEAGT